MATKGDKDMRLPLFVSGILFVAAVALAGADVDPSGHWEGRVEVPGTPLGVLIDLEPGPDGWTGAIDIPLQGARGLALTAIEVRGDSVTFAIDGVPGEPTFHGVLADSAGVQLIRGDFTQSGFTIPFRLGRDLVATVVRPQEPVPPYPYRVEEVGYGHDGIHLAATLTLPAGEGPFPAAVLITGSGAQNRNEEILGHKPFLVLADHLTRAGIAVLRADDRGVGGSTGSNANSTTADFAADALSGVRYLAARPEIDAQRIGLIGHSEGGIIGPMAAAGAPDEIAYLVLLAGTGVPLDEVILLQTRLLGQAAGKSPDLLDRESEQLKRVLDAVKAGADEEALAGPLRKLLRLQMAGPDGAPPDEEKLDAVLPLEMKKLTIPWMRFGLGLDPRVALRQVRCPVLALNGTLDLQVDADQNLPEIEKALAAAGARDVTLERLPGLNHLFQTAQTGAFSEYSLIEETFAPAALERISGWITERFGEH